MTEEFDEQQSIEGFGNRVPEGHKKWILAALMMTMMLAAMDNTIVSTAIPQIVGDLGGFSLFSWIFSIYLLIQTITIPLYGKLADMYGRKPVLIIGTIVFLVGSATCALSWNMISLIAFRGVQALGAGAIMATVNTLAGDIYSIKERAKIQGWLSSVWGLSAVIGPAIGGAFAEYISWRWIFLINIPIGIVSISLIYIYLQEKRRPVLHKIKFFSAALMLLSGSLLMFGMMEGGQKWPWMSYETLLIVVLFIVLLYLTFRSEKSNPEPIIPGWIWKKRALMGANLTMIGMGALMMAPGMFLPIYAQSVIGVGPIAAGFILASISVTWPLSSGLSGRLYLKIGFRNTAMVGIFFVLLGTFSFLGMSFPGSSLMLVITQLLLGAGFGLISTPMIVGVQSMVKWENRGVATGANMFSRYFGQTLGAALFSAVFNAVIARSLIHAPENLKNQLPPVNEVIETLQKDSAMAEIINYLKHIFHEATHSVYLGMVITGIITLIIIFVMPRKFGQLE